MHAHTCTCTVRRSTVRSRTEALQLREDLLRGPSSSDVSISTAVALRPLGPILNTVVSVDELFTTVVPLLRAIIHSSDSQMQLLRGQFGARNHHQQHQRLHALDLPILVVPSGLRQRLRDLFQNSRSHSLHSSHQRWGDLINADELAEPSADITDHGGTRETNPNRIDTSVGGLGGGDELIEDIEEC
jgi:hypothetical protein